MVDNSVPNTISIIQENVSKNFIFSYVFCTTVVLIEDNFMIDAIFTRLIIDFVYRVMDKGIDLSTNYRRREPYEID